MDQCGPKNARALMLNNATVWATLSVSPIWTALVESTSLLMQGHSNTAISENNQFREARALKLACQKMRHIVRYSVGVLVSCKIQLKCIVRYIDYCGKRSRSKHLK